MKKLKEVLLGIEDVTSHALNIEDLAKDAYNMATDLISTLSAIQTLTEQIADEYKQEDSVMYREFRANAANIAPTLNEIKNSTNTALSTAGNVMDTFDMGRVKYVR